MDEYVGGFQNKGIMWLSNFFFFCFSPSISCFIFILVHQVLKSNKKNENQVRKSKTNIKNHFLNKNIKNQNKKDVTERIQL